jgi:hypothetical protein
MRTDRNPNQGAGIVMICPKCGQQSDNFTTCSHCGIIFKKYTELEDRLREREYEKSEQRQQRRKQFLLIAAGLAVVTLLSLTLLSFDEADEAPRSAAQPADTTRPLTAREKSEAEFAIAMGKGFHQWDSAGSHFVIADDIDHLMPVKDKLLSIVRGTFGRGPLGFLISGSCHAIVGSDLSQLDARPDRPGDLLVNNTTYQRYSRELEAAEKKFDELRLAFIQRCNDCSESAYDPALKRAKRRVETLKNSMKNTERYLESKRNAVTTKSEYEAKTPTGIYPARLIESNREYNLSLVILEQADCESITQGNPGLLQKNDPVYAYTKTSNSGWSRGNYLGESHPNAPASRLAHTINVQPGDYGTPLLNQSGEIIAIIVAPKNGTPQAIPIDTALRILHMPL